MLTEIRDVRADIENKNNEYDTPHFYTSTLRRSKKVRQCYFCSNYIKPGQLYERWFSVQDRGGETTTIVGHVNASCLSGG